MKIECCFSLEPDTACKGAEKAFVAFAERIAKEREDESRRAIHGGDWFKSAVARVILLRAAEAGVSKADWYEGGYRADSRLSSRRRCNPATERYWHTLLTPERGELTGA